MSRARLTGAGYIERHDPEMRVILGELVDNAGKIKAWWTSARVLARDDPDQAMTDLIEAEIHLDNLVRMELRDSLRRIRAAIDLLDAELPDDEADRPSRSSGDISGH